MQAGNLYVYTINNPVHWIDPSGRFVIAPIPPQLIEKFVQVAKWMGAKAEQGFRFAGDALSGLVRGSTPAVNTAKQAAPVAPKTVPMGQKHHIVSNPIMREVNNHPTLRGQIDRASSTVRAMTQEAHRGYQSWHRTIDRSMEEWLRNPRNQEATTNDFWRELHRHYSNPDMLARFGMAAIDYINWRMR